MIYTFPGPQPNLTVGDSFNGRQLLHSLLQPTQEEKKACRLWSKSWTVSVIGEFPGFLTVKGFRCWPLRRHCTLPERLLGTVILAAVTAEEYSHPFPETRASLHTCCYFCCFSCAAGNGTVSNLTCEIRGVRE